MGRSTHFTASECLATVELVRLIERGEIPRFMWEYMTPGGIQYTEWENSAQSARIRTRTMQRVIEFHGSEFLVRVHMRGHQSESESETGKISETSWFVDCVERELRGSFARHPHAAMRTVWEESLPRSYAGIIRMDIPRTRQRKLELRTK